MPIEQVISVPIIARTATDVVYDTFIFFGVLLCFVLLLPERFRFI